MHKYVWLLHASEQWILFIIDTLENMTQMFSAIEKQHIMLYIDITYIYLKYTHNYSQLK